jgi:putative transposase
MYDWRKMTPKQREETLALRQTLKAPWHSPPHWDIEGEHNYLVSAACYEHAPYIAFSARRMAECEAAVLAVCAEHCLDTFAWCVLPNHYHLLVRTDRIKVLRRMLGLFHGRSSRAWNLEEGKTGRKVWFNCFEKGMKSEGHFYATMNYVHHNPVKDGYVEKWTDWPFSSAREFLERMGKEAAARMWREYPVMDYGMGWDDLGLGDWKKWERLRKEEGEAR